MKDIIIYGAGAQGRAARRILESQGFAVSAFADRDEAKVACGAWEGVRLISLNDLRELDKETAIIIGIGAQNLETLRRVDAMLTEWGFRNIFWSSVEMIESLCPAHQWRDVYSAQKMEISTRLGCPVSCRACPQSLFISQYKKRSHIKIMSPEIYKQCIDKVPKDVELVFTGFTEPFFNPDCADFIAYAFEKGHKVSLGTTLVGVNDKILDKLEDYIFLDITLHLPDMEHNCTIPVTDQYLAALKRFMKTHWVNVEQSNNFRRFSVHGVVEAKTKEALLEIGIEPEDYLNIAETLHDRAGNIEIDFASTFPVRVNREDNIFCDYAYYSNWHYFRKHPNINKDDELFIRNFHFFILLPNGDCTLCSSDFGLRHVFGNLLLTDWRGLYTENKAYDEYLDAMQGGGDCLCRTCFLASSKINLRLITRRQDLSG